MTAELKKKRMRMRRREMWMRDEGLTALLVALFLRIFVVSPMAAAGFFGSYGALVLNLWLALTLLSGVFAIGWRRRTAQVIVLGAVLLFALQTLGVGSGGTIGLILDAGLTILLLSILVLMVVWQIFREGPITRQRVQGSITIYLLLGLIWAQGFTLAALLKPDSFTVTAGTGQLEVLARMTYYSFVTLTTVGYGDISPVSLVTRSLANVEGLIGQLFPAILIARLVSMEIAARQTNNTTDE
ncbi:MAG TPA: ion channel [Pyrinomonadaceae bacterium]|nr:ion channel [Pyrinomonadaceae bacterium]